MGRFSRSEVRDEVRERYLGEIALLLDAARRLDTTLEPERKRELRRRILRTASRKRRPALRVRFAPVLLALAALVVGGAAFAFAERLGLVSGFGGPSTPTGGPVAAQRSPSKHRASEQLPAAPHLSLPDIPDPLCLPWSFPARNDGVLADGARETLSAAAHATPQPTPPAAGLSRVPHRRVAHPRRVAVASPPEDGAALSSPQGLPLLAVAPPVEAPAAALPQTVVPDYVPIKRTSPPAPIVPRELVSSPAPSSEDLQTPRGDSALFGQAMRKLRMERDPSSALLALHEHARAYPRSSLASERGALEVEALLALHRDRDALARLDGMRLEELPRSGERLVVRGELRAAARRWLDASADFDRALSRVSGSPVWHERALWGRAVARLRCGEREAGLADLESYRDQYPHGRFAAEAERFLTVR